MTIALALKVNDGIVLAADSASTMFDAQTQTVSQVYNNANKVFNLCKGFPLGAICWGSGSIGPYSVELLTKDLRERFRGVVPTHADWQLHPLSFTVSDTADRLKDFIFDEHYNQHFTAVKPPLGFVVAGYSSQDRLPELYLIETDMQGNVANPIAIPGPIIAKGAPEAILRLTLGLSPSGLESGLQAMGVPQQDIGAACSLIAQHSIAPLMHLSMPLQDAIDLAEYLVDATIKFQRFLTGAKTVGGPIELCAITKYEGFKWVKHKHYYNRTLNPDA